MNFETMANYVVMFLSAGLVGLGYQKRFFELSRLIFVFYLVVFSISFFYNLFEYRYLSNFIFNLIHGVIFVASTSAMYYKLVIEFEKYKVVVSVLFGSIFLIGFAYLLFEKWFNIFHAFVVVFDLLFVTCYVLYFKYRKLKEIR